MHTRVLRALPVALLLAVGIAAPATAAVIDGTPGPDRLIGTSKADRIHGYAGNDVLKGRVGADLLSGGSGADRLYPGKDSQTDMLRGGAGRDHIWVRIGPTGHGVDTAYAGAGNDRIRMVNTYGWVAPAIHCGAGEDTVVLPYGYDTKITGCEHLVSAPSPYD
jgi:Ca2+-binding RTX toxin-like protein